MGYGGFIFKMKTQKEIEKERKKLLKELAKLDKVGLRPEDFKNSITINGFNIASTTHDLLEVKKVMDYYLKMFKDKLPSYVG